MCVINFLLKAGNGVVLATEKKHKSILIEEHSTYKIEQVFVHLSVLGKDNIHFSYTPHPFICIFCRSLETLVWCTAGWAPITGCSSAEPERWHRLAEKFWETCFFHSPTSRTTTLCITRRSPRRSWCTEWRSSCRSTPSLAGYPASIISPS